MHHKENNLCNSAQILQRSSEDVTQPRQDKFGCHHQQQPSLHLTFTGSITWLPSRKCRVNQAIYPSLDQTPFTTLHLLQQYSQEHKISIEVKPSSKLLSVIEKY